MRAYIVGTSCTGKSTFAKNLADALEINHIELDDLYWLENWTEPDHEDFTKKVQQEIKAENWSLAGNYRIVRPLILERATHMVWLDMPLWRALAQALRRTLSNIKTQKKICNGNVETWRHQFLSTNSIFIWVLKSYWKNKRRYKGMMKDQGFPLKIIRIRTPSERDTVFNQLVSEFKNKTYNPTKRL